MSDTTSGGLPLSALTFQDPPTHIPDLEDGSFKTQLVVERSAERTVKINWWHTDDLRELPHNHPWDFTSQIIHGGYTDVRYTYDTAMDSWYRTETVLVAGDTNVCAHTDYHTVKDVLPGTVTLMTCGPVQNPTWGYLDTSGPVNGLGDLIDPQFYSWNDPKFADATYMERYRALNPHLRPNNKEETK